MNSRLFYPRLLINHWLFLRLLCGNMQTIYRLNVFHIAPVSLRRSHPYNFQGFPDWHLTKYHRVWNRILIMPHFQFSLVNIWAVPWALLRVHSCLLVEVILFRPEVTYDLSHVCIHVVEENIGGVPLGRIFMDPSVGIYHLLTDLWYHAEKPCKNGKVALYNKASALERVQGFSAWYQRSGSKW